MIAKFRRIDIFDLNKYIEEHFIYEVTLLQYTFFNITNDGLHQLQLFVQLESFLLHSRNLIDFFTTNQTNKFKDDIVASDFQTDCHKWVITVKEDIEFLEETKVRINKELAHLTTKRKCGRSNEKEWNCDHIYRVLKTIIFDFIDDLSDSELKNNLRGKLNLMKFGY